MAVMQMARSKADPKAGRGRFLYTNCPGCGTEQGTGRERQRYLWQRTEWRPERWPEGFELMPPPGVEPGEPAGVQVAEPEPVPAGEPVEPDAVQVAEPEQAQDAEPVEPGENRGGLWFLVAGAALGAAIFFG